jgi:hypothetical protein
MMVMALEKLNSGEISVGGVVYNRDPSNNSWAPEDGGKTISGNKMLELQHEAIENEIGNDVYYFPNDERFIQFQGTTVKTEELKTEEDKVAYTDTINTFFRDELGMLDQDNKFIPYKDPITGDDGRYKKYRGKLQDILEKILKDNNKENIEVKTSAWKSGIKFNNKWYFLTSAKWQLPALMKALDNVIMNQGNIQQSDVESGDLD